MSARKPIIGLTGGIASGKTSVARVLMDLGVAVVDADALAREVVGAGSEGLRAVVAAFGTQVLAADGSLDRERMAQRVFGDEEARRRLQAITHPRIAELSAQRIAQAQTTDTPYVVYDAPLLVEVGAHRGLDALIVVAADEQSQLARAQARDKRDAEETKKRIAAQLPLSQKLEVADYVLHNDGTLEELAARTRLVHEQIMQRFGLPRRANA